MGTIEVEHPWEQQEDVELDEGLIVRRKNLHQSQISATVDVDFSSSNGGSVGVTTGEDRHRDDDEEEGEGEEEEVKDLSQQNGIEIEVDEDDNEKEKQQKSEYIVYYDADKGIWNCRICSWDSQGNNQRLCFFHETKGSGLHLESSKVEANGVDSTFHGKVSMKDDINIRIHNQENGNGLQVIINQNGEHEHEHEHEKHNNLSDSSIQPSEISFEEVEKPEISDIEVIADVEDEFDVETVLKKQETHDLFCPNCNSCITKRVILRKRKRKIPVIGEFTKRNKPETSKGPSEVNLVSDESQPLLTSNEYDHEREQDVFRCLSCFSIFMPTGNGFKLFRMFGNKNNQENIQSSHKEVKKTWFFNFFGSDKAEQLNNQGSSMPQANSHTTNDKTRMEKDQLQSATPSVTQQQQQHLNVDNVSLSVNGNDIPPSTQEFNTIKQPIAMGSDDVVKGSNSLVRPEANPSRTTIINMDSEKGQVQSISVHGDHNAQGSNTIKQTIALESDTEGNGRITITTTEDTNTTDHLLTSYHTEFNDKSDYPGMFVVKPPINNNNTEPEHDLITPNHHDGLKLQVPPNIGSLIIDNSQMNQVLDVTIQTNTPDLEIGCRAVEQGGGMAPAATGGRSLDIVKSIVYGGLLEVIASLSVVASAVGAGAATLNVLALSLANIFGGLLVISHDLWDLKNEPIGTSEEDRYQQLLGRRTDFPLHMFVSLFSYLVFGFLPPVIYAFSFRQSNNTDFKLLTVAAASIACIVILAAGKAYVQSCRKSYLKTICYYVMFGFAVSGVSYFFGGLIMKPLEKIDLFPSGGPVVNMIPALVATY